MGIKHNHRHMILIAKLTNYVQDHLCLSELVGTQSTNWNRWNGRCQCSSCCFDNVRQLLLYHSGVVAKAHKAAMRASLSMAARVFSNSKHRLTKISSSQRHSCAQRLFSLAHTQFTQPPILPLHEQIIQQNRSTRAVNL